MQRIKRLCGVPKRSLSVYGNEDVLHELQSALLQAADAGENPRGDALFRSENDALPSGRGGFPRHFDEGGEEKAGKRAREIKTYRKNLYKKTWQWLI